MLMFIILWRRSSNQILWIFNLTPPISNLKLLTVFWHSLKIFTGNGFTALRRTGFILNTGNISLIVSNLLLDSLKFKTAFGNIRPAGLKSRLLSRIRILDRAVFLWYTVFSRNMSEIVTGRRVGARYIGGLLNSSAAEVRGESLSDVSPGPLVSAVSLASVFLFSI